MRDVAFGKKRLTLTALPKYIQGLGLSHELKEYFIMLVAKDESDVATLYPYTAKRLEALKAKVVASKQVLNAKQNTSKAQKLFKLQNVAPVYAALGTHGATLKEIQSKLDIEISIIKTTLKGLISIDFVSFDGERSCYIAKDTHLDFEKLGLTRR